MTGRGSSLRQLIPIILLAVLGVAAAGYVLVNQRLPVPFRQNYQVQAVLPAADGVAPGFGQAVNVSGVKVGTISKAVIKSRKAVVTFDIDRKKLPEVYADARADLRPITPLSDMRIELDPGTPKAGKMKPDGRIGLDRTSSPVQLSTLLSTLDGDTRTFLTSLLRGLGEGTKGRGPDLRQVLLALGPAVGQLGEVTRSLDSRRGAMARLVHNVDAVTKAARSDGRLAELVVTANRTLDAVARQDVPLRESLRRLPGTLKTAQASLDTVGELSTVLGPTARDLTPAVRQLPGTLDKLRPLTQDFSRVVKRQLRPLVAEAQPVARGLAPAVTDISSALPDLSRTLQGLQYTGNSLGYNPPGKDEGMMKWLAWASHNFASSTSTQDAHGSIFRALVLLTCEQLTQPVDLSPVFYALTGTNSVCRPR